MKNYKSLEDLQIHYNKIVDCINSCKTIGQMVSCKRMIETFSNQDTLFQVDLSTMYATLIGFSVGKSSSISPEHANYYVKHILKCQEV